MNSRKPSRPGPGRPAGTGRWGEKTEVMRVPASARPVLQQWLDGLQERREGGEPQPPGSSRAALAPPRLSIEMVGPRVAAGAPVLADDHTEEVLDLNQLCVRNPQSTFFVRVQGESMEGLGIHTDDVLVVDRSVGAASGDTVVALLDGEGFTVKQLRETQDGSRLMALPAEGRALDFSAGRAFEVWGVVLWSMKPLKGGRRSRSAR